MSAPWSRWCRLCAGDAAPLRLAAAAPIVYKYLAISLQVQEQAELPDSICRNCYDTLNTFDSYALQCERVQCMYNLLLEEQPQLEELEDCTIFRRNYLQCIPIDDKFLPICTIKAEEEETNGDIENTSQNVIEVFEKEWNRNSSKYDDDFIVKNESDGDDTYEPADDTCSEDDYVPLSSISGSLDNTGLSLKRKSKKIKHSPKAKRKKESKKKHKLNILEEIIENQDVDIKAEPFSDEDGTIQSISKAAKSDETKKTKKSDKTDSVASILSFNCYICKKECKNWHALCLHFRDSHDTRAKVLCCCGKLLGSRVSIGRHSASHGKSTSFNCTKCSKRFPRDSELQSHMISHLPKEEHPYVCCKCARRFTTPQLLKHHEKKHIPMEERMTHPCKVCKSKFASKSSLLMHVKSVHERLKPFVCDQCGKAFTTKGILEEHQVRHSDDRPHVCPVCHKSFKTKQRLAIHSDTHNDTVYQCPHCPMQLNSRRTLRMHLFVHDDFFRYQCNFCDKAFRRAKDLKNHNNLHTGRRPYSCPWCSRTFANGSNCRAHKRRMHPNELRIYDASEAMRNKVIMEDDAPAEDKKEPDSSNPKVIYATVKRKTVIPSSSSMPNFTFAPDVTEKESLGEKEDKTASIKVSSTKQEKSSPVHNYESSLSPLNLNASAEAIRVNSTCLSMPTNDAMSVFHNANGQFRNEPNPAISIRNNITSVYPKIEYKDIPEQVFNKTPQLYTTFSDTDMQNVYDTTSVIGASTFSATNTYSHYEREGEN